jgi:DNA-binding SARP family transcriptional activator/tetratricopeptide (TPR) repeat protein
MRVEFGVLGPLEASCDGVILPVTSGRQRTVLAMLVLRANRVVAVDDLAEALWGSALPPSARITVQNYVYRLRDALGDAAPRVETRMPGYLIRVAPDEADVSMFEARLESARIAAATGSWQPAATSARAALALWRGEPLADVPSEYLVTREVPRLTDMRQQAAEIGCEAALHLDRQAEVIGELRRLVASDPLRERLSALLMAALQADGRQAEALAVYQQARDILDAELGVEPGDELRAAHQRILTGEPALAGPAVRVAAVAAAPGRPASQVPRQLPAAVGCFTGRDGELALLTRMLDSGYGAQPPTMAISAIAGTAGVGKTALAVHWAHQVAERFADGQLYVNLRGYDPGQPVSAADALAGFLRALGVSGQDVPDEIEERTRLYRSKLAGRRMLVVLDNARDGEQVRPLLPGDPGCAAVVTSRDALAGLVAADGARRLDLGALPQPDAVALLRSLTGGRTDDDPDAAAELAALCSRLPLALRIAAELAAARPEAPLRELAAELAGSRLDVLSAGEDRADVRAVFSWSVRQLPSDVAGAFALTGLHPGEDFDLYATAALTGMTAAEARRVLGRLHRASLLQATRPRRYGMHDLLRAYAVEQAAAAAETGDSCRLALTRLFDYYLAASAAALDILFPAEAQLRPHVPPTATPVSEMPGEAAAQAWLDTERANLTAVVAHCADHGWPRHATGLAGTLHRYLMNGRHLPQAQNIYGHALQAARRSGDLAAEASALNGLGSIIFRKGRFRDAADHFEDALALSRRCGDRIGHARILRNLCNTELRLHNHGAAAAYYQQAIAASRDAGDSLGMARALVTLTDPDTWLGTYDQAAEQLRRALPVLRDAQDHTFEAQALERIGDLSLRSGELTQAPRYIEQAMAIYRRIANPIGVANGLSNMGEVSLRRGDHAQAISYLRQALALYRETGFQHGEAETLRILAEALHEAGQPDSARAKLDTEPRSAGEAGSPR